ncbi:MAG TPA: aminotransferase class IV, partial [Candidatus Acidoferrum sp.]|nr:aminotransferase class IV [Candidatus Acidoferrum sp.]
MTVFLNGEFVPEERALVSIFDRSFRYGDGLFEAVLVSNGKLFRWAQHFERLQRSAQFLRIGLPYSGDELREAALELVRRNSQPEAIVRLALSRGSGPRG